MDILNQFGVQPILLAAQVVNFLILLFILKKLLYKPILKVLEERKKRIEESLKNAEEIERKLAETESQAEKILAKASAEGQKILDQTNEAAAQIMEQTKATAAEIINKAQREALEVKKSEYAKLQQAVRENAANLVALVLEKVTGKKITKEDQKNLIEREVKNIS